ncbi:MAG: glycosidase [Clostridia bacterium]|nr:glycosidase [Clostridia bacterium]
MNSGAMLNAYPDSLGGTLTDIAALLETKEMRGAFRSFYILPSVFTTDLDRGFSVISYDLDQHLTTPGDMDRLRALGMDLKLDFILNHLSVQSPQFQDMIAKGDQSEYRDFFINWNKFWNGKGEMTEGSYIQPDEQYIQDMFFRKPGLPILMVQFPDGREVPYWNTFYQEVRTDPETGRRSYLGQMDVNIQSELVWQYYGEVLDKLAGYGASIVRLDAFGYASKIPGRRNFMNEPETWDILERIRQMAEKRNLTLLPEIHAAYGEGSYKTLSDKGYMTYDFFLPGLLIDAIENHDADFLARWAKEQKDGGIRCVNMLGCHDGIPLLDLKGLVPDERIQGLIDLIVSRGGLIKNLHGKKNMYYQVNATYFSALGCDEKKMLLARALQLFMPGKPQIWYLDLFAGENDLEAVQRSGEAGHKEINRTNLTKDEIAQRLQRPIVQKQLELLNMRNACPAFGFDAELQIDQPNTHTLCLAWRNRGKQAVLTADLTTYAFFVEADTDGGKFRFSQE